MIPVRARSAVLAIALCVSAPPLVARAQTPLARNDYAIDVFTGPALASGRIVALGGAYAGIGEGIDAAALNPASYAARAVYETSWLEWELSASALLPGTYARTDFDNRGSYHNSYDGFLFLSGGLRLQLANVGFGALTRLQIFSIDGLNVTLTTTNYGIGYAFDRGQVVLGVGARTATAALDLAATGQQLVSFSGTGIELGGLWRPIGRPFRIGVALRSDVSSRSVGGDGVVTDAAGVRRAAGFVLPSEVHMPWEVSLGFAWQIGRPLNLPWRNPHDLEERIERRVLVQRSARAIAETRREVAASGEQVRAPRGPRDPQWAREEALRQASEDRRIAEQENRAALVRRELFDELSRNYLLLSAEVVLTGPTPSGIGMSGFLDQIRETSGAHVTLGVRAGLEFEPIPGRLKVRLGSYLEPSRYEDSGYRVHATGGAELKLFRWDLFRAVSPFDLRISISGDITARYHDWGVGIGFWH